MSVKSDLEQRIRESYAIVCEYEQVVQVSDRPEERLRAGRGIAAQWEHIAGYLAEYHKLAGEAWPADIAEIAAHFEPSPSPAAAGGPHGERAGGAGALFDQRGQQVGQQINVAGDYVDRRQITAAGDDRDCGDGQC
jgi:hypothetical protein